MFGSIQDLVRHVQSRFADSYLEFVDLGVKVTYGELLARAASLSRAVTCDGWDRSHPVALIFPTVPDFYVALLGLQCAGICPSPLAPPHAGRSFTSDLERLQRVFREAGIRRAIVHEALAPALVPMREALANVEFFTVDSLLKAQGRTSATMADVPLNAEADLALVQFTSGSTSAPKGVALTHKQLLCGIDAIARGIELTEQDVNGQWLPIHHDMGLIGSLAGIAYGVRQHLWSPLKFLRDPLAWLHGFCARKASICAAPNFAYAALVERAANAGTAGLDLRAWRVAFNGAEPIEPAVIEEFYQTFAGVGFRRATMFPVYGLAETTLAVTFPALGTAPRVLAASGRNGMGIGERVADVEEADEPATKKRSFVSVGKPVHGHRIRIALPESAVAEPLQVGEIQVQGAAVMEGYYRSPQANERAFDGAWLRTGDLGFVDHEGRLYITGRQKEMMIINGRNFYPHDVEQTLLNLPACASRTVAVFARQAEHGETMSAVVEISPRELGEASQFLFALQRHVAAQTGVNRLDVYLVRRGSIPKTTSGKLRRLHLRSLIESRDEGAAVLAQLVNGAVSYAVKQGKAIAHGL